MFLAFYFLFFTVLCDFLVPGPAHLRAGRTREPDFCSPLFGRGGGPHRRDTHTLPPLPHSGSDLREEGRKEGMASPRSLLASLCGLFLLLYFPPGSPSAGGRRSSLDRCGFKVKTHNFTSFWFWTTFVRSCKKQKDEKKFQKGTTGFCSSCCESNI